jgi:hypothetical protein
VKKVEIVVTVVALTLATVSDGWYGWHVVRGPIEPALATWLIFAVATTLSLVSYLKHNDGLQPFVANAANRWDPIIVWAVVGCILFAPKSDKSIHMFDLACLIASSLIMFFWWATRKSRRAALFANLSVQVIMVAGYLPTFHKLVVGQRNTESFFTWGFNLLVGVLFLVSPVRRRDWLSVAYIGRAIICMAVILGLMLYFDRNRLF